MPRAIPSRCRPRRHGMLRRPSSPGPGRPGGAPVRLSDLIAALLSVALLGAFALIAAARLIGHAVAS